MSHEATYVARHGFCRGRAPGQTALCSKLIDVEAIQYPGELGLKGVFSVGFPIDWLGGFPCASGAKNGREMAGRCSLWRERGQVNGLHGLPSP
jgi:hypothetical protein